MHPQHPLDPTAIATLWLSSIVATAATLGLVVLSQGLVVLASGGDFIGLSVPPTSSRGPW
jgi:hypothetical protein